MNSRRVRKATLGKFKPQVTRKRRAKHPTYRLELIDPEEEQMSMRQDDTPPTKRVRFNVDEEEKEDEEEGEDASLIYDRLHIIEEGDEVAFRLAFNGNKEIVSLSKLHQTIISEAERTPPDLSDGLLMNKLVHSILSDPSPYQENAKRQLVVLTSLVAIDPFGTAMQGGSGTLQQNKILRLFYQSCVPTLQARLQSCARDGKPIHDESTQISCQIEAIITALNRLIDMHRVYMRRYVIEKDLLSDVVVYLHSKRLSVALAALDMFQKILVRDNADYNSYIRRVNALSAVEKCWEANNGTRTALYSALLEFFGHAMKSIHHGAGVEPIQAMQERYFITRIDELMAERARAEERSATDAVVKRPAKVEVAKQETRSAANAALNGPAKVEVAKQDARSAADAVVKNPAKMEGMKQEEKLLEWYRPKRVPQMLFRFPRGLMVKAPRENSQPWREVTQFTKSGYTTQNCAKAINLFRRRGLILIHEKCEWTEDKGEDTHFTVKIYCVKREVSVPGLGITKRVMRRYTSHRSYGDAWCKCNLETLYYLYTNELIKDYDVEVHSTRELFADPSRVLCPQLRHYLEADSDEFAMVLDRLAGDGGAKFYGDVSRRPAS